MFRRLAQIKVERERFALLAKEYSVPCKFRYFALYVFKRAYWRLAPSEFFQNRLWDKTVDRKSFYEARRKTFPNWKNLSKKYVPNASPLWLFAHRIDFNVSKILYPGLTALDYFRYEFYRFRREVRKTFVTERGTPSVHAHFNGGRANKKYARMLADKKRFNEEFADFLKRDWIAPDETTFEKFVEFCRDKTSVIAKPALGTQGRGIFVAPVATEAEIRELYEKTKDHPYVVEELLKQCDELNALNPSSVNTVRIYSVLYQGRVCVAAAILRVGAGDLPVDNYCSGGFAAEIDVETGVVKTPGASINGEARLIHPKSGRLIIGFKIPQWEEAVKTVQKAHLSIPQLRYLAWDVVVCKDRSIAFLEANEKGGFDGQQHPGLSGKMPVYRQYW